MTTNNTRVALITGSARRVGAEIARTLHYAGFNIVLHYNHSEAEANDLCQRLNSQRAHSAVTVQADLAETTQLQQLMKQVIQAFGQLDVLVNNASRFYRTAVENTSENSWNDLLDSNLKSAFFLSQAALPHLKESKGCIINITDVHGERPMRDYSVYCIAKAGLIMLTKTLAKELAPDIRVNAVSPGAVMLPEGENTLSEKDDEKILSRVALRRHGTAQDVAKAVLYLATNADYVTGTVLPVDGGRSLTI